MIIVATCCFASLPTTFVSGSPFEAAFASSPYARGCPESYKKFEIMSGFAFSSAADSFASIPVSKKRPLNFFPLTFGPVAGCVMCHWWLSVRETLDHRRP